jgi:hypothetical protein
MKAIVREQVQNRRRSFWDPFGAAYQDFELPLKSKPVMITVNPLPAGKPADFSGLTGDFKLTAKMDKAMVKSNEAVNLTVTISGEGNLFQVKAPNITFPPDIEAYDPKVTDNIKLTAGGVSGSKTFEYVLIPRYAGDFEIGPFEFSYFDSKSKTFKTSSQDAFQLVVEKGKGEEEGPRPSVALGSKEDIRLIGSDIRYIKQGQYELREQGGHFYRSGLFFGLLAVPALLFVALMGYAAYMQKMGADVAGMKSRGATKLAKKRLEKAKKLLAENQSTAFYEEVFKALTEYVAFRHHISVSELSKGKIRETLTAKGIAATSIDGFIAEQARSVVQASGATVRGEHGMRGFATCLNGTGHIQVRNVDNHLVTVQFSNQRHAEVGESVAFVRTAPHGRRGRGVLRKMRQCHVCYAAPRELGHPFELPVDDVRTLDAGNEAKPTRKGE